LPNTTTATNTVLHNLRWDDGDVILYTSGVYGALEKTIDYVVETTKAESVRIELDLPQSDDFIVHAFRETLKHHKARCDEMGRGQVRVAVFDTIVSMPGLRMPFERLIEVCHEEGVLSLVDAAHGIGHIPLDLSKLNPDFLVTNCHKWLFVPRSVAAFFVPKRNQHYIRSTMPTSHGFKPLAAKDVYDPMPASGESNPMVKQFEYFGTIDGAPYCTIEECIRFRDEVCGGESAIHEYCTTLAKEAERVLVEKLGTESFNVPETHRVFFAQVRLPITVGSRAGQEVPLSDIASITQFINQEFVQRYRTFLYVLFYRGAWWVRLSISVFVDLQDCMKAADILKDLSQRVLDGAYRA
jgi:hercynylcysteine S-oxide lyase